jgi:hypothetical protein
MYRKVYEFFQYCDALTGAFADSYVKICTEKCTPLLVFDRIRIKFAPRFQFEASSVKSGAATRADKQKRQKNVPVRHPRNRYMR